MQKTAFILGFCVFLLSSCAVKNMSNEVMQWNVPQDLHSTTLLVKKFEASDTIQESGNIGGKKLDSLKRVTGFSYEGELEKTPEGESDNHYHELAEKIVSHLDEYNNDLTEAFKGYNYKYQITGTDELAAKYSDSRTYRYMLMEKPVHQCYIDPNGQTILNDRFSYYFYDRMTGDVYPEIELYSKQPKKIAEAIVKRINSDHKVSKHLKEGEQEEAPVTEDKSKQP